MQGALLVLIAFLSVTLTPSGPRYPTAHATSSTPILEVWNNQRHSNNITDQSLTPGSKFTVSVNVSNAGPISAFDITLNYDISPLLPVPITTNAGNVTLSPGLFDGSHCTVFTSRESVLGAPYYQIRLFVLIEGPCNDPAILAGTGTLFSVTFYVTGTGATSIDILQASAGAKQELVIQAAPVPHPVPNLKVLGAYFENIPGLPTPPIAQISYLPSNPGVGAVVGLNATESYDPGRQFDPDRGIKKIIWDFSDSSSRVQGTMADVGIVMHTFLISTSLPAVGYYPVRLVVVNGAGIPMRAIVLVYLNPGRTHDLAVSISANPPQLHVGEKERVSVTVANVGNQDDFGSLNVTYQYQGMKTVGRELNFSMPIASAPKSFQYDLDTSSLIPQAYTITAAVQIIGLNITTGIPYPDANPSNNLAQTSFTVLPGTANTPFFSFSTPILAVGAIVALAAIFGGAQLFRRRRRTREEAEDKLSE